MVHDFEHKDKASASVIVSSFLGIHARPAAQLVEKAQTFECEITLKTDKAEADARSILEILSLAATQGTEITIEAKGMDADAAIEQLSKILN